MAGRDLDRLVADLDGQQILIIHSLERLQHMAQLPLAVLQVHRPDALAFADGLDGSLAVLGRHQGARREAVGQAVAGRRSQTPGEECQGEVGEEERCPHHQQAVVAGGLVILGGVDDADALVVDLRNQQRRGRDGHQGAAERAHDHAERLVHHRAFDLMEPLSV